MEIQLHRESLSDCRSKSWETGTLAALHVFLKELQLILSCYICSRECDFSLSQSQPISKERTVSSSIIDFDPLNFYRMWNEK
jgi:hypothetical protein